MASHYPHSLELLPRFLVPPIGRVQLNPDGYMADPLGPEGSRANPDVIFASATESIPCVALLGEPGMGKSTLLKLLHDQSASRKVYVDLRAYTTDALLVRDIFESTTFVQWLNSKDTLELYLDSLDECLIHVRTVAALLADSLRKYPVSRLRLRIASRSADWPRLLDGTLDELWSDGRYRALELAPLRRMDVELAVQRAGLDPNAFLKRILVDGAQAFASRPLTLRLLIDTFKIRGDLPSSPTELYEHGCSRLVSEASTSRVAAQAGGRLSTRERMEASAIIAAASLLSKSTAFRVDESLDAPFEGLTVFDSEAFLASLGSTPAGASLLTVDALGEVLRSALFSGRGTGFVGWAHWTYAEYLCAVCLVRHLAPDRALPLLTSRGSNGHLKVIPQLREVAAWCCAFSPPLRDRLIENDPLSVARSSVAGLDYPSRARVVEKLMTAFSAGEAFDSKLENPIRFDLLCHPGLASQLLPVMTAADGSVFARCAAIEMAATCKVTELIPDLLRLALRDDESVRVREAAARAIAETGDEQARRALRPLLSLDQAADPRDQLRAAALRGLLRAGILGNDVWRFLTPRHDPHHFGSYALFISGELPRELEQLNPVTALEWVAHYPTDVNDDFAIRDLQEKVLEHGWDRADDPRVLGALAQAILPRLKQYQTAFLEKDQGPRLLTLHTERRRALLKRVVERAPEAGVDAGQIAFSSHGLVADDDFEYLLAQAVAAVGPVASLWAALSRLKLDFSTTDRVELVRNSVLQSPAVAQELASMFQTVDLTSPEVARIRAEYRRAKELQRGQGKAPVPPFPPRAVELLDAFEAGNSDAWWHLNFDMAMWAGPDGGHARTELEGSLTELPAWETLDEDLRLRVRDAGYRYLLVGEPNTAEWIGTTTLHRPAAAGYRALVLLLRTQDARLESIPPEVWAKWAPIIIAFPAEQSDESQMLVARLAYRHASKEIVEAVLRVAEREDKQHGVAFVVRRHAQLMDAQFADALYAWLKAAPRGAGTVEETLEVLLPLVRDCDWAVALVADRDQAVPARAAAASALLRHRSADVWPALWPELSANQALGESALVRYVEAFVGPAQRPLLSELTEDQLTELYEWLATHHPPGRDPKREGAHWVGPEDHLIDLRSHLLVLLKDRGTGRAVEVLRNMASREPLESWIRMLAVEAEEARLRAAWLGVAPSALAQLLTRPDARVAETDGQLLDIVVESLARFQAKLLGETPAAEDLWDADRPKDEEALSDRVKRHLSDDLSANRVIVNREVEVRRGSLTDIRVEAASPRSGSTLAVTVEVKGCWHRELETAMESQLARRYLAQAARSTGVYLVCWFAGDRWNSNDPRAPACARFSLDILRALLVKQAGELERHGFNIAARVLDCRAPPRRRPAGTL